MCAAAACQIAHRLHQHRGLRGEPASIQLTHSLAPVFRQWTHLRMQFSHERHRRVAQRAQAVFFGASDGYPEGAAGHQPDLVVGRTFSHKIALLDGPDDPESAARVVHPVSYTHLTLPTTREV